MIIVVCRRPTWPPLSNCLARRIMIEKLLHKHSDYLIKINHSLSTHKTQHMEQFAYRAVVNVLALRKATGTQRMHFLSGRFHFNTWRRQSSCNVRSNVVQCTTYHVQNVSADKNVSADTSLSADIFCTCYVADKKCPQVCQRTLHQWTCMSVPGSFTADILIHCHATDALLRACPR